MGDNTEKTKKIILIAIVSIVIIAVILIVVLSIVITISSQRNNMIINGEVRKIDDSILTTDTSGNVYFSIEKMAPIVSYEFYNGVYGQATEDRTKCYVINSEELAAFEMDSNTIYKLLIKNSDSLYESYTISLPVKRINDKLYTTLQGIQRAFNIDVTYNSEKNVLTINTLPYLYSRYNEYVKGLGYTSLADEFVNQKAILKCMLVVLKDRQSYGVLNLSGDAIIGTKYKKIEFMENTEEFLVLSDVNYGVVTSTGATKIDTTYQNIKVIDSTEGLYLVKSNERYGILKRDGSILLYPQYDYIGVKDVASFPNDGIKNPYVLLDNYIPVYRNGYVGLYRLDGTKVIEENYFSTLGCILETSKTNAYKNVLIIPASEGVESLVMGRLSGTNSTTYGIFNPRTGKLLAPDVYSSVYRDVINNEQSYYMVFAGVIYAVKDRINSSGASVNEENTTVNVNQYITPTNNTVTENSITNEIGNTIGNTAGTPMSNTISTPILENTTSANVISPTNGGSSTVGKNNIPATNSGNEVVPVIVDTNTTAPVLVQ